MTTDTKYSASITNLDASPPVRANSWVHGGEGKEFVGTVEASAVASAGSTYDFFRVKSGMRPVSLLLSTDALSAGALDIGIFRTIADGGVSVASSCLATVVSLGAAVLDTQVNLKGKDIADAEKTLWELAGLTKDPQCLYDIRASVVQTIGNAGTLTLKGRFV